MFFYSQKLTVFLLLN